MSILGRRKKIRWDNIYKPYTERGHRELLILLFKKPEPELIIILKENWGTIATVILFKAQTYYTNIKLLIFKCTWTNTSFKPKCVV